MSERPDLSKRRTIVPAPDEGVDPIDTHRAKGQPAMKAPAEKAIPQAEEPAPINKEKALVDLNTQVTAEVMETIDFAKFKTKLTKRELVQRAILHTWSEYRPTEM